MFTWEAGRRSGVTDDREKAFRLAETYADGGQPVRVRQVILVYALPSLVQVHWPVLTWTHDGTEWRDGTRALTMGQKWGDSRCH